MPFRIFPQINAYSGSDDAVPIPENCLQAPARERIVTFERTGKSPGSRILGLIGSTCLQPEPLMIAAVQMRTKLNFGRWCIRGTRDKSAECEISFLWS
jgi:hypothetical protein